MRECVGGGWVVGLFGGDNVVKVWGVKNSAEMHIPWWEVEFESIRKMLV